MLKDYLISYVDDNGMTFEEHVLAFDERQAVSAYLYTHPGTDMMGLSCTEL